tara:strand:+ start:917 stop:1594 length:678 start_codon:yes stop_codon:yes gene_type:complete
MGTLEKILNIIKMKNEVKSYGVKFYAETKLEDGRIVATEDEQFEIGSKVFAVSDDGEATPLSAGNYKQENGNEMTIGEKSEILDLGEDKEAEDVVEASEEEELSEENKEEMADAEDTDWAKTYEELKDRIAELEEKVFGKKAEEETEELSEETEETEEKTEMSSEDIISELTTEIEELKSKITELSGAPATEPINYNPEGEHFSSTVNLGKLSTKERAAYYINNK